MLPTIDIIMPCYYSNEVIRPALEKIANQTLINNITLIIVNDCSPNTNCEYQDLIQEYSNKIKIRYFKTEKHSGPGIARQLGLDNAISDFIMFQDDDDELFSNNTIETLINIALQYDINNLICISGQIQILSNYLPLNKTWTPQPFSVQGSLFNRKLLKELNIYFEPILSFKEEDTAFSTLLFIKSNKYKVTLLNNIVYIKKRTNDHISITMKVTALPSILSLMGAKAYPIKYLIDNNITNERIINEIINVAISFIPNLINNLMLYLDKKSTIEYLTVEQYQQIEYYIKLYQLGLKQYNINIQNINFDEIEKNAECIFSFDPNNFFGTYSKIVILNFDKLYPIYLNCLKNKIK